MSLLITVWKCQFYLSTISALSTFIGRRRPGFNLIKLLGAYLLGLDQIKSHFLLKLNTQIITLNMKKRIHTDIVIQSIFNGVQCKMCVGKGEMKNHTNGGIKSTGQTSK